MGQIKHLFSGIIFEIIKENSKSIRMRVIENPKKVGMPYDGFRIGMINVTGVKMIGVTYVRI